MPRLSAEDLASRLAYDRRVVERLRAPWLHVLAQDDARGYTVTYGFPTLADAGVFVTNVRVRFDLLAGGNYPYTEPHAQVVSRPQPWGPHVQPGSGWLCTGNAWKEARARMLLAHLVIQVARLLNFDEPDNGSGHMNSAAASWWRSHYHGRPLNPDLAYPILPIDLTHGIEARASSPGFRPRGFSSAAVGAGFRKRSAP